MESSPKAIFLTSLFRGISITLVVLVIWHVLLSGRLNFQLEKNIQRHLLLSETVLDITHYEKRQEKIVSSQTRLHFIATLRRQNKDAALILKELAKSLRASIVFSAVKWQDGFVWIEGYTRSDVELVTWIDAMRKSTVLNHPVITSLADKNKLRYFQLRVGIKA